VIASPRTEARAIGTTVARATGIEIEIEIVTVTVTVTIVAATGIVTTAAATIATHADREAVGDVSRIAATLIFIALAFTGGNTAAAGDDATALFSEAKVAFDAQDFSRARALFERALAAGMDGPAVHYNIGAAAFRAGDLPRAERAFREVARTPSMTALAHYNLGLVALDRRDEREARDWFQRTLNPGTDSRLMALAARRLEDLPESRSAGAWSFYARGGAGHDDNIALRSDSVAESATGAEDSFGELTFAGIYTLGDWRLDGGGNLLEYAQLDDFSQSSFYLGAARGFRLDRWYFELGAYGSRLSFGGDVFEQSTTAGLLATRMFAGGSRLRAQLRAGAVDGQGEFTGLTGDRTELGLFFDKSWRAWNFAAHTRAERNDSEDAIFATRWLQLGAEARYTMSPIWGFTLNAALRRTTRPALSETVPGWQDQRLALQAGATRTLWKQAQVFLRYEHERNSSPVAGFDYDRNRVSAALEYWY
jgi:tetratricopeptide (TPR) repeat protein